jgi:hypothetical protein
MGFHRQVDEAARADLGVVVRPPMTTIATAITQAVNVIHPIDFRFIVQSSPKAGISGQLRLRNVKRTARESRATVQVFKLSYAPSISG